MHELNHDIEDLFRRAAESYPLKTVSNWDSINSRLDVVSQKTTSQEKNKKKRFIFLLLFLFLAAGSYISVDLLSPNLNNSKRSNSHNSDNRNTITQKAYKPGTTNIGQVLPVPTVPVQKDDQGTIHQTVNGDQKINYDHHQQAPPENFAVNQDLIISREPGQFNVKPVLLNYPVFPNIGYPIIANEVKLSPGAERPATSTTSLNQMKGNKQPKLYLGITAGPGINSVRSFGHRWAVKGGLIAGLQFNSKFSVETGLIFTKNYYEAKADHFDEKGIAGMLTGGRQLNEVHGSNQILEIPVNIRYGFSARTRSVYAGAGLTSHIMTRESNWYLTTINGNNEMLYGNYNNKKLYFASALTITTGIQAPLGKKTLIRVEPYTQFPLRGIGIGKIRLRSTGLTISLSRTTQ